MKKSLFLFLLMFVLLFDYSAIAQSYLSFRTLLSDADKYNNKEVTLMGIVEKIHYKRNADNSSYVEIDIYKDLTLILDDTIPVPKKLKHGDLIRVRGTFYSDHVYHRTLYNNLIIGLYIIRLETS